MIHVIRGIQVILDSDLAVLYRVETGALNRAVKRNIARFPESFMFQLTEEELETLRCQFGISYRETTVGRGGRRVLPYAFTEQGIAMLSGVLRSDTAIQVSINIMNAFVEMRKFIAANAFLFERISQVELKQLEYQKKTDERFEQVFKAISVREELKQKVFFDGQIYDALSLIVSLIQKAEHKIHLVDGYISMATLDMLSEKKAGVDVVCYTLPSAGIKKHEIDAFNAQYPTLTVLRTTVFHDRFLILDEEKCYHFGPSLKDAGKKCFAVSLIQEADIVAALLCKADSTSF